MTIIRTYTKLNCKIRHCTKEIKHAKNTKKAYLDEATYHQAVIDSISQRFNRYKGGETPNGK